MICPWWWRLGDCVAALLDCLSPTSVVLFIVWRQARVSDYSFHLIKKIQSWECIWTYTLFRYIPRISFFFLTEYVTMLLSNEGQLPGHTWELPSFQFQGGEKHGHECAHRPTPLIDMFFSIRRRGEMAHDGRTDLSLNSSSSFRVISRGLHSRHQALDNEQKCYENDSFRIKTCSCC